MKSASCENEQLEITDLTRGFLHDMNNLFTITLASLSAAKSFGELPGEARNYLDDAISATLKSTELASLLMRIWNGLEFPKELGNVGAIIEEAVNTVKNTISSEILITCSPFAAEKLLFINKVSVVSALVNLLLNAEKAIKEHNKVGLLTVECKMIDRMMEIVIDDNGCAMMGMKTEVSRKFIMQTGNVHGIGLGMVEAIIRQHCGYFKMERNEAGGTSAIVGLPVAALK